MTLGIHVREPKAIRMWLEQQAKQQNKENLQCVESSSPSLPPSSPSE